MIPVIDVLANAKRLIEEHGWCQGDFLWGWRHDVVTAILKATGGVPWHEPAKERHERLLGLDAFRAAVNTTELYAWNDAPGRTKQDVLDAFDRAMELVCP